MLEYEGVRLVSERAAVKRKWLPAETAVLEAIVRYAQRYEGKTPAATGGTRSRGRSSTTPASSSSARASSAGSAGSTTSTPPRSSTPRLLSGQWDSAEDRKIAAFILASGKKWSEIAKSLDNHRTEHMVKNRFKTLTIRLRKKFKDTEDEKELLEKFLAEASAGAAY